MLRDGLLVGWLLGTSLTAAFFGAVLVAAWVKERRERKWLERDGWEREVSPGPAPPAPVKPPGQRTMWDRVDVPDQPRRRSDAAGRGEGP